MPAVSTFEELPAAARRHLARGSAQLVYAPYHTATWRIDAGPVLYLKAARAGGYPTLAGERDRCLWLRSRGVPAPEVLDHGEEEGIEWLVTVALPGRPATDPDHLARPERTVPVLAEGLRAFHEVDPEGCPFDHTLEASLRHAAARVARREVDPTGFHEEHGHLSPEEALARAERSRPGGEDLVVCHGDYCFPNVMVEDGRAVGFLDLGEAGLGDRWRDLAVATWSVTWNVGPGYEDLFLDAYGADWDFDRRDLYRLLYDLES